MKVGINGFGRVGRHVFRILEKQKGIEVAVVNDLADAAALAHLLQYDSLYGQFDGEITAAENSFSVNGRRVHVLKEKNPAIVPWSKFGVELVIESTGAFKIREEAAGHLAGTVRKVIATAPLEGADMTLVKGVNEGSYNDNEHDVISAASCTTNALAPIVKVIQENFGIIKGTMVTTHAYTNDQRLLDLPHTDLRRARAAALSLIPTTTGAAKAIGEVLPDLDGRIGGFAVRVPVPTVSMLDLVLDLNRKADAAEVNRVLSDAARGDLKGILGYTDKQLVSADFKGSVFSAVIDSQLTMVTGETLARVVGWYDNEWGYSCRVADIVIYLAGKRQGCNHKNKQEETSHEAPATKCSGW